MKVLEQGFPYTGCYINMDQIVLFYEKEGFVFARMSDGTLMNTRRPLVEFKEALGHKGEVL